MHSIKVAKQQKVASTGLWKVLEDVNAKVLAFLQNSNSKTAHKVLAQRERKYSENVIIIVDKKEYVLYSCYGTYRLALPRENAAMYADADFDNVVAAFKEL